ncbi:MAG TPA: hypothetical protein VII09_05425 [Opitutaceae bacterium]
MIHPPDTARTAPASAPSVLQSDRMLNELLALNDEMIEQLHFERREVPGTTDFLTGMIEQHEKAAASPREQLERHRRNPM